MAQKQIKSQSESVWERRWRERIAAWRESGQTQQAFCQTHGVSVSSFSHWKSRLAKREEAKLAAGVEGSASGSCGEKIPGAMRWNEVHWPAVGVEAPQAAPDSSGFEIVLPRGLSVRLGPRFEAESLRRLLAVLEERSC